MIYMEQRHLDLVLNILAPYPYVFYAFGSRVKGTHQKFSDLDLCVKEDLPLRIKIELTEAFEESNLPFKVEIIEWNKISDDFKKIIANDLEQITLKS